MFLGHCEEMRTDRMSVFITIFAVFVVFGDDF